MGGSTARLDVSAVPPQGGYIAKQCPVRAQNNVLQPCEPRPVSPAAERRMARGRSFEEDIFAVLASVPGAVVVDRSKPREQREIDTRGAMDARAPMVIGGRLPADVAGRRVGEPDVLVLVEGDYAPVDVKHHRTLDPRSEKAHAAAVSHLEQPTQIGDEIVSTRRLSRDDLLQLAHYQRMLERLGFGQTKRAGIIGVERRIVWHLLDEPLIRTRSTSDPAKKTKLRSPIDVYDFEFGFRLDVLSTALAHQGDDAIDLLVVPAKFGECDECEWWPACGPTLESWPGDVTLLPRVGWEHRRTHVSLGTRDRLALARLDHGTASLIASGVDVARTLDLTAGVAPETPLAEVLRRTPAQSRKLEAAGFTLVGHLDRIDPATAAYPSGTSSLPEQIDLARAALGTSPVYRRRGVESIEVPRGDVEVDVDMENSEEGVYLWGSLLVDREDGVDTNWGYRPFAEWRPWSLDNERSLLAEFWTWLLARRAEAVERGLVFRAYCYSEAAENYRLRVASRGTPLEEEIEAFIASDQWVDLRPIVERNLITGHGLGLKKVAPLAGFSWAADDAGGDQSMVLYDEAVASGSEAQRARDWLLQYNEDDCRATLAVRNWLTAEGASLPSIESIDPADLRP